MIVMRTISKFMSPIISIVGAILIVLLINDPVFAQWDLVRQIGMIFAVLAGIRMFGYLFRRVF